MSDHPLYGYDWIMNEKKTGHDDGEVRVVTPIWRGLLQSETGLEILLQKLPSESARKVRLLSSQGKVALESSEWRRAEASFKECFAVLEETKQGSDQIGEGVCNFLLAWAGLPLAQLYQLLGSFGADLLAPLQLTVSGTCKDMLEEALFWSGRILELVLSLGHSIPHLVLQGVCRSHVCTAEYELGDLMSDSKKKEKAVDALRKTLPWLGINTVKIEALLCFYLWCDHYFFLGNLEPDLEVSRRWIQKANRLWGEHNRNWYSLQIEVELSMKLEKFGEAEEVLKDSMPYFSDGRQLQQIREWLQQCYKEMSSRDSDQVEFYSALALSFADPQSPPYDTRLNISGASVKADGSCYGVLPFPHPINDPSPEPVGSSLGLVPGALDLDSPEGSPHWRKSTKLPLPIRKVIKSFVDLSRKAERRLDWEAVVCNLQMCREFLKLTKTNILDPATYDWLLTWLDLQLARLYQYRLKKPEKAVELWEEMRDSSMHLLPKSHRYLTRGHVLNLDVAEYECSPASKSGKHVEIDPGTQSSSPGTNQKVAERERELCFWLYFHHYAHKNFEASWKWLQRAKNLFLKDEHRLEQGWSVAPLEFFSCEYTFLRCEADICMRLQDFEKAIGILTDLLTRPVRVRENNGLKKEANEWLRLCLQKCGCTDEPDLEDIADEAPSPTGCYYVMDPAVNQLVQSVTGLEHHLHKLPLPFHLAIETHGKLGRASQSLGDWEGAAFHYEWCKELLELLRVLKGSPVSANVEETHNWLVVWADVSLVEIYGFAGLMQPRRALDLLREMICALPANSDGDPDDQTLSTCLMDLVFKCLYQCAFSDSKLKDEVIERYRGMYQINDTRACEEKILRDLYLRSFTCCNFEECWKYIHELNERLPRVPDDSKYIDYLCKEVICLSYLGRFDEAKKLLKEYWRASGKADVELPTKVRFLWIAFGLGSSVSEGHMTLETSMSRTLSVELIRVWRDRFKRKSVTLKRSDELHTLMSQVASISCELHNRRSKSCVFDPKTSLEKNFEDTIKRLEDCLKVSDGDRWGPSYLGSGRRTYFATPTKSSDYLLLGTFHMMSFLGVLDSLKLENIKDVETNKHFSSAVTHFNKCIELELPDVYALNKIEAIYALVQLYGEVDEYYGTHLVKLYHMFGPHRAEQHRQQQSALASSSGSSATDTTNKVPLEGLRHLVEKIEEYLKVHNPMEIYGQVASGRLTSSLRTMVSRRNAKDLIQTLDAFSGIYPYLQSHYYRQATFARILKGCLYYFRQEGRPYANRRDAPCQAEGITSNTNECRIPMRFCASFIEVSDFLSKGIGREIKFRDQEADHCDKEADDSCKEAVDHGKEAVDSGKRGGKEVVYSDEEAVDSRRDVSASKTSSKVEMLLPLVKDEGLLVKDEGLLELLDVKDDYIEDRMWKAFLYAERERTRVMLYEVGSDSLDLSFDVDDTEAINSIRRDCSTLLKDGAVFVEYSRLPDQDTYLIYLVDQQGKLSVTHTRMKSEGGANIEKLLEDLYKSLEPQRNSLDHGRQAERIDRKLEHLYDVLIAPVAVDLAKMNIEQKLIVAPAELLWQVPFAALRNNEKYLIESHTIAFAPSLRTLKVCSDRLEDSQSSSSNIGLGSIVALGNPAYGEFCDDCERLPPLEQTKKEVEYIAKFLWNDGTPVVKKLLWEQATAEELLDWATRPSRERFRQTLVHIGSHVEVSDGKPVLLLACPHAPPLGLPVQVDPKPVNDVDQPAVMNEIQSSDVRRGKIDYEMTTGEDDDNYEEGGNDDVSYDKKRLPPNRTSEQSLNLGSRLKGSLVSGEGHSSTDYRSAGDSSTRSFAGSHDLKAEDISRSEWRAELVVLSACRTSRGKLTAVEGVLSLARAFIISGVPCAVASLWKVDDKDTCTLMTMFYDELLGQGTDIASALCSAMRKGLGPEQNFPVKSWAPFLVYGVPILRSPALTRADLTSKEFPNNSRGVDL